MSSSPSAKQIIYLHKNPSVIPITFGKKIFIPKGTQDEIENVNNSLDMLKDVLSMERVEKKSARATAEWLPERRRAKITKRIGHIVQFGYREDKNYFLLPEEALFLLEMNRLELSQNGIPLSIEQAYMTLLDNDTCSIKKYRLYQNLAHHGFHITDEKNQTKSECETENSDDETPEKKIKIDEMGPKNKNTNNCYSIYTSDSHKKLTHRLKLQQSNYDPLTSESVSTSEHSLLTSFSGVDSVAFYQLQAIDFVNK